MDPQTGVRLPLRHVVSIELCACCRDATMEQLAVLMAMGRAGDVPVSKTGRLVWMAVSGAASRSVSKDVDAIVLSGARQKAHQASIS